MKLRSLFLVVMLAASLGCSSPDPLVGKWKPSQRYDRFHETWEPAKDEVYLEFSSDGKFSGITKGKLRRGSYRIDRTGTIQHLILNDESSGTANAAFKLEGSTMTMKTYLDTGADFPPNLEPASGEPAFELVILERQ